MKIELKPHTGYTSPFGRHKARLVTLAQDRIEVDGDLVGFVGHQEAAPICLIGLASPGVVDRIRNVVNMYRGEDLPDRKVSQPPRLKMEKTL